MKGTPSIAGVVASVDGHFAQWPASLRLQESRKEMITFLKEMMIERLLRWQTVNKKLPEKILVYRDGVSEGFYLSSAALCEDCYLMVWLLQVNSKL